MGGGPNSAFVNPALTGGAMAGFLAPDVSNDSLLTLPADGERRVSFLPREQPQMGNVSWIQREEFALRASTRLATEVWAAKET